MNCPNCGNKLLYISNFCPDCGVKLELPLASSVEDYEDGYLESLTKDELLKLEEKTHNPRVQFFLGQQCESTSGFIPDAALDWYQMAAIQGYAPAQTKVGKLYIDGKLPRPDHSKALTWLLKPAEEGDVEAQANIGYIYSRGFGVPKNYQKAVEWFQKAADQGHEIAKEQLEYYKKKTK